jgi:hypothetical protein
MRDFKMAVRVKISSLYITFIIIVFIGILFFLNAVSYSNGVISLNFNYNTYNLFKLNPITFLLEFGIDIFIVVMLFAAVVSFVKD